MTDPRRSLVLKEAETWIGTPFHHEGRVKGAGVDCGQFLLEVYERVGLMAHHEVPHYPPDFHLHRDREWYVELLSAYCVELNSANETLPADIAVYKRGRVFSHGTIIVSWPRVIHSHPPRGVQFANGNNGRLGELPVRFFRPEVFVTE